MSDRQRSRDRSSAQQQPPRGAGGSSNVPEEETPEEETPTEPVTEIEGSSAIPPGVEVAGEGDKQTQPQQGGAPVAARTEEEGSSRKRDREEPGASSSAGKKRGEVQAGVPPNCYICGKGFSSYRAMFGHLRSHPNRPKGAFPPPAFTPPGSPGIPQSEEQQAAELLAPVLLDLAREVAQKLNEEASIERNIDLNVLPEEQAPQEPAPAQPQPPPEGGESSLLDLNIPPPPEDGDGNE